jgi:hypothetical protein
MGGKDVALGESGQLAAQSTLERFMTTMHDSDTEVLGSNSREAIERRREAGVLGWRGPMVMLFARAAFAVVAQGLVAGMFAMRGSATPWKDAEPWLPVYGTLIDAGCLALLWRLTRREGIRLWSLVGFDRARFARDVWLGIGIIPIALLLIFSGTAAAGWIVYGTRTHRYSWGICRYRRLSTA